jgi:hypothetical protein
MKRLKNIQFIPVIGLFPTDLGKSYPYPSTLEERYQHWKKVIRSFGIGDLEPVQKGYDYVKMMDINNNDLSKLILMAINGLEEDEEGNIEPTIMDLPSKELLESLNNILIEVEHNLEEFEEDDIDNLPTSFEGGLIMMCDGEIFVTPQCCVSLQDYQEWFQIREDNDFGMIWIGHPWICYLKKGHDILLTGLVEKDFHKEEWRFYHSNENNDLTTFQFSENRDKNAVVPSDFRYAIAKSEFENALIQLEKEIEILKKKVSILIQKLGFQQPDLIAQCLIGGNGSLFSYNQDFKEMVYEK